MVGVGQRCVVRVRIADIELRNARGIKATIVSPQGVEKCQDVSFDELESVAYVSTAVDSVGSWSMWLGVRFEEEAIYTPAFVFAEVDGEAKPCDAPYVVDVDVAGESVTVTPPHIDVDGGGDVSREEFDALSSNVAKNTAGIENKQDTLTLSTKPNGNIVIGNLAGQTKEFMPATPSGDPMHYQYLRAFPINVNTPRGLQYNEATDRWSYMAQYGGITDLTTEEVATIFARSGSGMSDADNNSGKYYQYKMRTNFIAQPIVDSGWGYVSPTLHYLYLQSDIEVAVISPYGPNGSCTPKAAAGMFFECEKLRRVIGKLNLQYTTPTEMFKHCFLLEDINIENLKTNISFADSPLLSKESLLYMIENCASSVSFTITLHPDVYAKCTRVDEGEGQYIGEWWDEIDDALGGAVESKNTNITLASA